MGLVFFLSSNGHEASFFFSDLTLQQQHQNSKEFRGPPPENLFGKCSIENEHLLLYETFSFYFFYQVYHHRFIGTLVANLKITFTLLQASIYSSYSKYIGTIVMVLGNRKTEPRNGINFEKIQQATLTTI